MLLKNSIWLPLLFCVANVSAANKVQEINIGNGDDPKTLDPITCNETACRYIVDQLFEGLVKYDVNGNTVPASAVKWEVSKDGLTWTFHMRSGLKWSDGTPLTAHDFVYSLQRLVDPVVASEQSQLLENVVNAVDITNGKKAPSTLGVHAPNASTLVIVLIQPTPSLLEILKVGNLYPVQKRNVEKFGDSFPSAGKLVSNGAYKLTARKAGDKVVIEKNPYYWNSKETYITRANFFSVVDSNSEFRLYETGQLDLTNTIPVDQFKAIKAKYGARELKIDPFLTSYYYMFNLNDSLFKNNLKLRTALSIAIDRDVIARIVLGMGQRPLYDMVPYGIKGYKQQKPYWQDWTREKQLAEAKKLYSEAGYSDSHPLKVHILYNTNDAHRKIATAITSMWKKALNVNAIPENEEWKTMLDKRNNGQFEIMRMGGVANINDPYDFLGMLRSYDPGNTPKYNNPKFDALLNSANKEQNLAKRQELMEQAGKILVEDVPLAPIYSYVNVYLVKPHLVNFKKNPMATYYLSGVSVAN